MRDLFFFLKLFSIHWFWLAAGLILSLITAFAGVSLLTLSGWFITTSAVAGAIAPEGVAFSFNFMQPAAEIRALAIIRTLGRYAERIVCHEATFRILARLRVWFFASLIPCSSLQLSSHRGGDLLSRMTADIDLLDGLYLRLLTPVVTAIVAILSLSLVCYFFAPGISLIVFVMLMLSAILVPLLAYTLGQSLLHANVQLSARLRVSIIDIVQGLAELISFQAFQQFQQSALELSNRSLYNQRKINRYNAIASALNVLISQLTVIFLLLFGVYLIAQGRINGIELTMLIFCVMAVFELTTPLPLALQSLAKMQQAASRVRAKVEISGSAFTLSKFGPLPKTNDLQLDQVNFSYAGQQQLLLDRLSLDLPWGSKIAIMGPSGVGKSTLLKLILHDLQPLSGQLLFSQCPYAHFKSDDLWQRFGVLSQRTHLFAANIKENLLIGKANATDLELNQVIFKAGLYNYVQSLPDGLQTWVGEDGVRVSGGEARRIALARVLLKNAPILLLDEPTEGLDHETETEVLLALKQFSQPKTLVMVTHKLSVLDMVDTVYYLDKGKLIQQ